MNRREFLAAVGVTVPLSGCVAGSAPEERTATPTDGGTPTSESDATGTATPADGRDPSGSGDGGSATVETGLARFGIPPTICEEAIRPDPGIYAIVDPTFASDWSVQTIDPAYRYDSDTGGLLDRQTVIGLTTGDTTRAYPLTVLNVHEVVNDTVGVPVLVTFCPICRSGMVADRRLDGRPTTFAVSGLLWQPERVQVDASELNNRTFGASATGGGETGVRHSGNLVMYDAATRSYWSQILAQAICGPRTGTDLDIRPSTIATWGEWRTEHPDTEVLLPPPHSGTVPPGTLLGSGEESDQ